MDDDFDPTPEGLVRCLEVLAEEAVCMNLGRTFAALKDAISICQEESEAAPFGTRCRTTAALLH